MPVYDVLEGNKLVAVTAASVTLGWNPGNTEPCSIILTNPSGAQTITLPLSTPTISSSTGGNYIPGAGEGYTITIVNMSTQTITFAAASGDSLVNNATNSSQYSNSRWISDATNNRWIRS